MVAWLYKRIFFYNFYIYNFLCLIFQGKILRAWSHFSLSTIPVRPWRKAGSVIKTNRAAVWLCQCCVCRCTRTWGLRRRSRAGAGSLQLFCSAFETRELIAPLWKWKQPVALQKHTLSRERGKSAPTHASEGKLLARKTTHSGAPSGCGREREKERCLTQTASYLADGEYYLPPIERTHRVWMCLLQCFAPTTRRARRRLNLISVFAANECAQLALIYPQMNGASAHTDKRSHCTEPACLSCKTSTLSSSQWDESRFEVIQRNKNRRDWHKTNFYQNYFSYL